MNNTPTTSTHQMDPQLDARHRKGMIARALFMASILVAILALMALLYNIINQSFGLVIYTNKIQPEILASVPLEELSRDELVEIFQANVSAGLFRRYDSEVPMAERTQDDMLGLVYERVVEAQIVEVHNLRDSILNRQAILANAAEKYDRPTFEFRSWANWDFITSPQSNNPQFAGIRTAILGSLWVISITIVTAFPIGVAAAIYLEEYATANWVNRVIQTNINNLAGVPSIIYGILGLAMFVRALEYFTSGMAFGVMESGATANGRTILSAGLTLALLVLPVVIINAQEAIRAVPSTLRQASYGLGATKWQTTWYHVLPAALPGILTGTILAMSRALGETAPLVVIGASTFIPVDPSGPFSKFTVLPIQIYQWTSRPQEAFRFIAGGAIVVLISLLLMLNTTAIILRNKYSRKFV